MEPSETRTFEELACWQAGRELRRFVRNQIVPQLPAEEKFRLADQLIRASRSITANIAEGHGRFHFNDNTRFCRQARASAFEVLDHLLTAADEGHLSLDLVSDGRERCLKVVRILNGYVAYLQRMANSARHDD